MNYNTGPLASFEDREAIRQVAVRAAEAGQRAVLTSQLDALREEDVPGASSGALSYEAGHSGDTPIALDATAREAVREVMLRELPPLVATNRLHEGGEESGGGTVVLRAGDVIFRTDDLDGSVVAECLMNNHSTVVTVDVIREPTGEMRRARHLAGAIALATGMTVSWVNESKWLPAHGRHSTHRGRVYMSGDARGVPEFRVGDARYDRRERTFAGVASKSGRYNALVESIPDFGPGDIVYNLAGTPVVAGLIGGAIHQVIEVMPTSLHDSVHLIPHQLLGGRILRKDSLQNLDYLALYERETLDLSKDAKPVPPFIAQGGVV